MAWLYCSRSKQSLASFFSLSTNADVWEFSPRNLLSHNHNNILNFHQQMLPQIQKSYQLHHNNTSKSMAAISHQLHQRSYHCYIIFKITPQLHINTSKIIMHITGPQIWLIKKRSVPSCESDRSCRSKLNVVCLVLTYDRWCTKTFAQQRPTHTKEETLALVSLTKNSAQ